MIITEVAGVNWILPNFKDEYGEVAEAHGKMGERYHAHFPNQETWSAKARLGSKQQVQSNWNVKNTGAFDGTPINEIPEEQRSRVSQMFKNSEPIELPIILKDDSISKLIRLSPGDICEITRFSNQCGEYPYYRLCK